MYILVPHIYNYILTTYLLYTYSTIYIYTYLYFYTYIFPSEYYSLAAWTPRIWLRKALPIPAPALAPCGCDPGGEKMAMDGWEWHVGVHGE